VQTQVGQVGALACWEHYNPLARYSLMAQHEQIHCSQFPGSLVGPIFAEQTEVTLRHHALESACFVVNATGWLSEAQIEEIAPDDSLKKALRGGCYTSIISPEGVHLCEPIREGEGMAIADLDFSLIHKRKRMMDAVGHYARPDLLQLQLHNAAALGFAATIPESPDRPGPQEGPQDGPQDRPPESSPAPRISSSRQPSILPLPARP
jgi:nitrilase